MNLQHPIWRKITYLSDSIWQPAVRKDLINRFERKDLSDFVEIRDLPDGHILYGEQGSHT